MSKWIKSEEMLPEDETVLGWDSDDERCVFTFYYNRTWYIEGDSRPHNIVAWMPLPEYKEGANND